MRIASSAVEVQLLVVEIHRRWEKEICSPTPSKEKRLEVIRR